jgi:CheY-like chemotaxis protein
MLILFFTTDLVFPSRVAGSAANIGARMETAASQNAFLKIIQAAKSADTVVLLDLATAGIDPAQLIATLKACSPPPRAVIAFGPHVHEAKLAAARAAGCDLVLSRGQFDAQIGAILEQFAAH